MVAKGGSGDLEWGMWKCSISFGRPYGETDGWTASSGDGPEKRAKFGGWLSVTAA